MNLCKYVILLQTFHLFIYLFIICTNLWFPVLVSYDPFLLVFILQLRFFPDMASGSWHLCPFNRPPSFFETPIVFWHKKMIQAHPALSLTWLEISLPRSLSRQWYLEAKIWVQNVLTANVYCNSLLLGDNPGFRDPYFGNSFAHSPCTFLLLL